VLAGVLAARLTSAPLATGLAETAGVRLALAGLLVGLGTGWGNGCTSGHGICGLARMSRRSLVAVPVFMGAAILTVLALKAWS